MPVLPAAPQVLTAPVANRSYVFIGAYSAALYSVLLIAPVVGAKIADQYGVDATRLGLLFSLELGAFSLATIPAYLWLRRVNLRYATVLATAIVVAGNVASAFTSSFEMLMVLRVITALAAGSITVIILSLSARTSNPGRAFGLFVVAQLGMGALILALFPLIFADAGVGAIYLTLAAVTALCLPSVGTLDANFLRASQTSVTETTDILVETAAADAGSPASTTWSGRAAFGAGLIAVLLFYVALSGVWTFMSQISTDAGNSESSTSLSLALATVAGIVSALIATALGEHRGKWLILAGGYVAMALSIGLLLGGPALARFAIASIIFKFAWTLILPYLLSAISSLGGGGQVMNTVNLMIGAGFAIGPVLAGALIGDSGFTVMLVFSLISVLASLSCVGLMHRAYRSMVLASTITEATGAGMEVPQVSTPSRSNSGLPETTPH